MHRLTQGMGVPLVSFSLVALGSGMILGTPLGYPVTLAHLACLGVAIAYARVEPRLAAFVALLFAASLPLAAVVSRSVVVAASVLGVGLCVAGGWRFGRQRSFLVGQALLAPLFLAALWLRSSTEPSLRLGPAFGGRRVR